MFDKYDVVMFTENHKWFGTLGFIDEVKSSGYYTVGVPIPMQGIAYIHCYKSDIEKIGRYPLENVED